MYTYVLMLVVLLGNGYGEAQALRSFKTEKPCLRIAWDYNHSPKRHANAVMFCAVSLRV